MTRFRWLSLLTAAALIWMSGDLAAQGRGNGRVKNQKGGGPAFCRSGAGHPVHGWEWCRQRGWDRRDVQSGQITQGRTLPGTAVPRGRQTENYPYGNSVNDPAFDNGYADGYEKGLDDGQDGRDRNPTRHAWYRAADRNYDSRYGSRAAYANVYREGFRSGYEQGYSDGERYGDSGGFRWPF
jgi:hypothetical protein